MASKGKAGVASKDQTAGATAETAADATTETGVTDRPEVGQNGDQVTGDAAGAGQADFDALANVAEELGTSAVGVVGDVLRSVMSEPVGPVGYIVRCHRDRGIWRAGRFWPPENVPVPAHEITAEQLDALRAEPLLSVVEVKE